MEKLDHILLQDHVLILKLTKFLKMVSLNDYLYNGDTVLKILKLYSSDLKKTSLENNNPVDLIHCNFLIQLEELLEHNDFLTVQSQTLREFYKYMAEKYPFLAFTFKGRIKSLVRAEEKFNGKIVSFVSEYYQKNKVFPSVAEIKNKLTRFRDLIAYRIIISMPRCHIKSGENREEIELAYLYEIANALPAFLEQRGFSPEMLNQEGKLSSPLMNPEVVPYYKDYIVNENNRGYRSLHITLYDNNARSYIEVQLRTKEMDDYAEIGPANHLGYEKRQEQERARRESIPEGQCIYFDEAFERGMLLQQLELAKVDVNLFAAADNRLVNDGCGFYKGRLILPYEHLSRFQNDLID